ncbi:hypothetical protein C8R21_1282 [Nitrosospira multiformis]|uniref:Uncharacterized protein n=1 Tax=Nitrosospira multiformis TaxID=1231 RepID=A0A2T5I6D5_9PROT|nr:hypothetical protein C8R21_1282 [Nitrosospira multiformis]
MLTIYVYLTPNFMNPDRLGNSVSKIKTLLGKAAERSFNALWAALGCIIETLRPPECRNYFANSGMYPIKRETLERQRPFRPCKPLLFGFWMGDLDIRRT